jgi:hypothetical protein
MFYKISLRPIYLKHKIVFRLEVNKVLSNKSCFYVSCIGYYDTNVKMKKIFVILNV